MKTANVAYTEEYQKHRATVDFLFTEEYKYETESKPIFNGEFILETSYYSETPERHRYLSRTEVYDCNKKKVAEFRNIDHSVDFFSQVEHSNGKRYLFFSIDLYGYSILDLSDFQMYHYVPEESFKEGKETFIWTDIFYCKNNNILAVDGCFWACPFSTHFYDFSVPEELPYDLICSSYDMDGEINIDRDVIPVHWNDDGTIVIKCTVDENEEEAIEKTIDIVSRRNKS